VSNAQQCSFLNFISPQNGVTCGWLEKKEQNQSWSEVKSEGLVLRGKKRKNSEVLAGGKRSHSKHHRRHIIVLNGRLPENRTRTAPIEVLRWVSFVLPFLVCVSMFVKVWPFPVDFLVEEVVVVVCQLRAVFIFFQFALWQNAEENRGEDLVKVGAFA